MDVINASLGDFGPVELPRSPLVYVARTILEAAIISLRKALSIAIVATSARSAAIWLATRLGVLFSTALRLSASYSCALSS